ncbi:MAG: ATP-binding protein [Chloroflexota bacterium]
MERFFNTEGPVKAEKHYAIDPLKRCNLSEIIELIHREKYFILHAPRQTGKTSLMLALMDYLNDEGIYHCLYINTEVGQAARENVYDAIHAILSQLAIEAEGCLDDAYPLEIANKTLNEVGAFSALNSVLTRWSQHQTKPIVLLLDEVDSLVGDTLVSLLRQLRAGYNKRPERFPQSIILCGVRDIQDYRIHASSEKAVITGGSAFNIKAESLRVGDLDKEESLQLYKQHTNETGQQFTVDALERLWGLSQGQLPQKRDKRITNKRVHFI